MMKLTTARLLEFLDAGENDPFIIEMLSRDAAARRELQAIKRVRKTLGSRRKGSGDQISGLASQVDEAQPAFYSDRISAPADRDEHSGFARESDRRRFHAGMDDVEELGTLHVALSPSGSTLWLEPKAPRRSAQVMPRIAASVKSVEATQKLGTRDVAFLKNIPELARSKQGGPADESRAQVRARKLHLEFELVSSKPGRELLLRLTDNQWTRPARNMRINLVPVSGALRRLLTDKSGEVLIPVDRAPIRVRIEADPTAEIDVVVHSEV
jgi:hypothetical protein